jgi:hypothetical protein
MSFPPSLDTTAELPSSSSSSPHYQLMEQDEDEDERSNNKLLYQQEDEGDDGDNCKTQTVPNTTPSSHAAPTPGDKIAAKFATLDGRRLATLTSTLTSTLDGRRVKKMTALAKEKAQDLKEHTSNSRRSSDPRLQKAMSVVGITDHSHTSDDAGSSSGGGGGGGDDGDSNNSRRKSKYIKPASKLVSNLGKHHFHFHKHSDSHSHHRAESASLIVPSESRATSLAVIHDTDNDDEHNDDSSVDNSNVLAGPHHQPQVRRKSLPSVCTHQYGDKQPRRSSSSSAIHDLNANNADDNDNDDDAPHHVPSERRNALSGSKDLEEQAFNPAASIIIGTGTRSGTIMTPKIIENLDIDTSVEGEPISLDESKKRAPIGQHVHGEDGADVDDDEDDMIDTVPNLSHLSPTWHKAYYVVYRPSGDPSHVSLRQRGILFLTRSHILFVAASRDKFEVSIDWSAVQKCEPWSSMMDGWLSGEDESSFIKITTTTRTLSSARPNSRPSSKGGRWRPYAATATTKVCKHLGISSSCNAISSDTKKYYFRLPKQNALVEALDVFNTTLRLMQQQEQPQQRGGEDEDMDDGDGKDGAAPSRTGKSRSVTTRVPKLPPVAPDPILSTMMDTIVGKRTIRNTTLSQFLVLFFTPQPSSNTPEQEDVLCDVLLDTEGNPFPSPHEFQSQWYQDQNKYDLKIPSEWTALSPDYAREWCREHYDFGRTVTFCEQKQVPMQGLCDVHTTSEQCVRKEGDDRCIFVQHISMTGIPYSDTFSIEVRMVVARHQQGAHASRNNNVHIEVGVFVNFTKTNM